MLFGTTLTRARSDKKITDTISEKFAAADNFTVVDTVEALRAYAGSDLSVYVRGHLTAHDGLGAFYNSDGATQIATNSNDETLVNYNSEFHDDGHSLIVDGAGRLFIRNAPGSVEFGWRDMIDFPDRAPIYDIDDLYDGDLSEFVQIVIGTSRQHIGAGVDGIPERAAGPWVRLGFEFSNLINRGWSGSAGILRDADEGAPVYDVSARILGRTVEEIQVLIDAAVLAGAVESEFHPEGQDVTPPLGQSFENRLIKPIIDLAAQGRCPNEMANFRGTNQRRAPLGELSGPKLSITAVQAGINTVLTLGVPVPVGTRFVCDIPGGGKFKKMAGVVRSVNGNSITFNWDSSGHVVPADLTGAKFEILDAYTALGFSRWIDAIFLHYVWAYGDNDNPTIIYMTETDRVSTAGKLIGQIEHSRINLGMALIAKYNSENGIRSGVCDMVRLLDYDSSELYIVNPDGTHATVDESQAHQAAHYSAWRFANILEHDETFRVSVGAPITSGDLLVADNGVVSFYDETEAGAVFYGEELDETTLQDDFENVTAGVSIVDAPNGFPGAKAVLLPAGIESFDIIPAAIDDLQGVEVSFPILTDWGSAETDLVGVMSLITLGDVSGGRIGSVEAVVKSGGVRSFVLRVQPVGGAPLKKNVSVSLSSVDAHNFSVRVVRAFDGKAGFLELLIDGVSVSRLYGIDSVEPVEIIRVGSDVYAGVNSSDALLIGSVIVKRLTRLTKLGAFLVDSVRSLLAESAARPKSGYAVISLEGPVAAGSASGEISFSASKSTTGVYDVVFDEPMPGGYRLAFDQHKIFGGPQVGHPFADILTRTANGFQVIVYRNGTTIANGSFAVTVTELVPAP